MKKLISLNLSELSGYANKVLVDDTGTQSRSVTLADFAYIQQYGVPPQGWHLHNTEVTL